MTIDKHREFKIAAAVLGFTFREFAKWHNTSDVVIGAVARGSMKSARLSAAIDDVIAESEQVYLEYLRRKIGHHATIKGLKAKLAKNYYELSDTIEPE